MTCRIVRITAGKLLLFSSQQVTGGAPGVGAAIDLVGEHAERGTVYGRVGGHELLQSVVSLA